MAEIVVYMRGAWIRITPGFTNIRCGSNNKEIMSTSSNSNIISMHNNNAAAMEQRLLVVKCCGFCGAKPRLRLTFPYTIHRNGSLVPNHTYDLSAADCNACNFFLEDSTRYISL